MAERLVEPELQIDGYATMDTGSFDYDLFGFPKLQRKPILGR